MTLYEELEILDVLGKIAARDGTSVQKILRKLIREYVKAHAKDNDQFKIENWSKDPSFMALPTSGELLKPQELDAMIESDFWELHKQLTARHQEIEAAAIRRGRKWNK